MPETAPHRSLSPIDELHRRVGRNVLMFQRVEHALRFMLPYMHPSGAAQGADAMRGYRKSIESRTLGALIEDFKASITGTRDWWDPGLQQVLTARNELIHDFFRNPRFSVIDVDGIQHACTYLDEQYRAANEWHEIIRVYSHVLALILIDANPDLAKDFGMYRERLVAQLPRDLEIIDQRNPRATVWESTRVVTLLREAERHAEAADGMTLLSRAGQFLKEHAPGLRVADYGLGSLRRVLEECNLFDVATDGDGCTVRYRSKKVSADRTSASAPSNPTFSMRG